ncbi:MAG TPA: hypothetical protein VGB89_02035 [Bacteroidota bacterium]
MKDPIDRLLQLAFLEGVISTRGAYEKQVAKKQVTVRRSAASRELVAQRLERELDSVQPVATVGSFLQKALESPTLQPREVSTRLGITANVFAMLTRNRVSPLKISAESWKRFMRLFQIPVDDLVEMIRRTQQLVHYRSSFQTTLARYDTRKNKELKATTLAQAAEELYSRADLPLPDAQMRKIEELRTELQDSVGSDGKS